MGGESRYEIHQTAYIKLVLHALKHRTSAVNAVLLGRSAAAGVEIVDSVPLFHSQIGLLPPLEIALIMIEEYYEEKGLSIVGYFHANERYDDFELGSVAKNIGDHITRYFPQAAVLLLDNKKLESLQKGKDRSPVVQVISATILNRGCKIENFEPLFLFMLRTYISYVI
ncbi:ER membrane protein complex subunit 8/9 homolog [Salvia miltiorrhiza]|uniref:ER membrane protein complex subunit 8/9 homolog n=1 Tax=Salvia miltiorrhiza TaxID=226208 RepID=UPI0025ACA403|nr:ER membrane protein complex subunit 8/9 homolog [Salvia miltiorrhiza]XP_057776481.1 ER membrane protein complex subunit 8/9 homolog [Salvia miltiorrhiza]